MDQHQVPQNIASYEFRLVGDMTLKQFFQVAAGGLIALAFYASPLPGVVKIPGIFIFGVLGVALAFLPIEERPLSTWILLFARSIYSPTYFKRNQGQTMEIFAPEETVKIAQAAVAPGGIEAVEKYLATAGMEKEEGAVISNFEEKEESFLKKVISVFHQVPIIQNQAPRPGIIVEEEKQTALSYPPESFAIPRIPTPGINQAPPPFAGQVTQNVVPYPFAIPPGQTPQMIQAQATPSIPGASMLSQPASFGILPSIKQARFAATAAPPLAPVISNTAVGQVVDGEGNAIAGAILEIQDSQGHPARALRTNRVGHFLTATPLIPGVYQIIIEKDGYEFEPVQFAANDTLLQPMEIKGRKTQNLDVKTQN